MSGKLSSVEMFIYFSVWILANLYSIYKMFEAQTDILNNNPHILFSTRDFSPGWSFVGRPADVSDVEWSCWKYFIQTSWYYLMIQFCISEILRRKCPSFLKYWYIISSALFVTLFMGIRQMIIIIMQPVIFATIIFCGGNKSCVWLTGISLLATYNTMKFKSLFWYFLESDAHQDEVVYLVLCSVAWIQLRCISFSIDYIDRKEKSKMIKENDVAKPIIYQNIINMFSYVLYLPMLYVGPVILYEDFQKSFSVNNGQLLPRLKIFLCDMLLFMTYTFILDLALHYFYFFAMQYDVQAISKMPTLAMCGGGLWMGLEFHMKYVISYGTTAAFARLDNLEPPPTPRCIARIHVYSQMWRYFDVGLYKFLVKYIYKPVFGVLSGHMKLPKIIYKLTASLSTFVFVLLWHGTTWHILIWSILNYVGILFEYSARAVAVTERYKHFKQNVLKTDQMEIRFVALLSAPLLAISAISNFYLFAGSDIGNIYFGLFKKPTLYNFLIVLASLYSCCQVSMALKDVPSRTGSRKLISKAL